MLCQDIYELQTSFLFAILTRHSFDLHEDMNLQKRVLSLQYKHLKFIDLELNVANKTDKYHFLKVVAEHESRDVYLMAIASD